MFDYSCVDGLAAGKVGVICSIGLFPVGIWPVFRGLSCLSRRLVVFLRRFRFRLDR